MKVAVLPPGHSFSTMSEPAPLSAEQLRTRFLSLLEAGIAIASEHSLDQVLQKTVEAARDVVGARYAAIGVISEDGRTLSRFETSGLTEEQERRIGALPTGHGLLGLIVREARPIRIPRISDDPRRHGFPPSHPPMESFLGVPIRARAKVFGNLYITEKLGADEFSEEDERIAVLLAARAATAIDAARLMDEQAVLLANLQQLHRQRDQFFAMINHELRNALTGVYGWAELLQRSRSPETAQRAGREVYEAAERTIQLLNNLLDLSRLDAGKLQAVFKSCDIPAIIERSVNAVGPAAQARRLTIRQEYLAKDRVMECDPIRLEQILVNLLTNAVRHSPQGEAIVVRVEALGDELLIHVIDRGPGISVEDQPKIFEPFIRVDPESGIGSGLGLPVSRRMAEIIGGRLSVASDLGRGATFTLLLPIRMKEPSSRL